jgi:hypothetical protein
VAGDFACVRGAFVHAVEHGDDHVLEGFVTVRAAEAACFLEIGLGETAFFATKPRGWFGFQGGRGFVASDFFDNQVEREIETAGCADALLLRARLAKVQLMHFVVKDLSEVYGGGFSAVDTFELIGHV